MEVRPAGSSNQMNQLNQMSVQFDLYNRAIKTQLEDTQLKKIKERLKGENLKNFAQIMEY